MSEPPPRDKKIARAAARAFGTVPEVHRYWDANNLQSIDMVVCFDSPWAGVTSCATVGMSHVPIVNHSKDIAVRSEFVGACGSDFDELFEECLSTAAFCVLNSGWFVAPGVVFPDVMSICQASSTMSHMLFLPPFLWDERLSTLDFEDWKLAWLMAIPISDTELRLAESQGVPALETLMERHQIDVFNLERPPVV